MEGIHDKIRDWWDEDAATYDVSAGHALSDPVERAAWRAALERALPTSPSRVLDVGTGTGALALLAAELGHEVTGVDISAGMLTKAREKAASAGLDVSFVEGAAEEAIEGPFDAVMERHVLWTVSEPVAALRAWRERVVPGGRLAVFEGSWGGEGPFVEARDVLEGVLRRRLGSEDAHHGPYPPEVLEHLPLRRTISPTPFIESIQQAGWRRVRIARLRDVEWAAERRDPWPLGWLGRRPRYALIADA
jgi:ubiquinone/menaquinone biosynthesis C-methylase UbiE